MAARIPGNWATTRITLALAAFMVVTAAAPHAQMKLNRPGHSGQAQTMTTATTYNPQGVRTQMMAIHGFSRAGLEAASTDVSAILQALISDGGEMMVVRRQAIKALRLFPTDGNFAFIKNELDSAPASLQRVYLVSLRGFTESKADETAALVAPLLASEDVGVRHAAVGLAGRLTLNGNLRAALSARLNDESEPGVQAAIRRVLAK
jgi:hypothetical protein